MPNAANHYATPPTAKVVPSEALGPGSVLVSRERRESLGKEEFL